MLQGLETVRAGRLPEHAERPPRDKRRDRDVPLYEELATRLEAAIDNGALRPGDRLPSVRALRRQEGLSTATVMAALARLEFRGLVESRPRSGSFVRSRRLLPPPVVTRPSSAPKPVSVGALIQRIAASHLDPRLVPLGNGSPSPSLLPVAALSRALAAVSRPGQGAGVEVEPPEGHLALRRAIARRALAWGFAADPDDVLVTAGAAEAVCLALRALTEPGDAVAIESPAYFGTLQVLEWLGLRAIEVPCHPLTGLDLDALEQILARQRVAAVLAVPTFSNPSGSTMPEPAKRRLVELLAAARVPLVEDDTFGELAFEARRPPTVKSFDRADGVLLAGSFSKTLCPGWRLGFLLAGRHRERAQQLKYAMNGPTSAAPQRAVARFLETAAYDRHLRRYRAALAHAAEQMRATVTATFPEGTRVSRPLGGCVLWVELPPSVSGLELHEAALAAGVSITPGGMFGPHGGFEHFVRLVFCHPWGDALRRGVETVGRLASRLATRAREPA